MDGTEKYPHINKLGSIRTPYKGPDITGRTYGQRLAGDMSRRIIDRREREKLASEERRARIHAQGDVDYGKVMAAGGIAKARASAEAAGALERETPLYKAQQRNYEAGEYSRRFMALPNVAALTTYEETKTGEVVPVLPTPVRQIQQKYSAATNMNPDERDLAVQSEVSQWKKVFDTKRKEVDDFFGDPTNEVPEEFYADLDLMEGTSDESISAVNKWYRKVQELKAKRRAAESPAVKAGTGAGGKVREDLRLGNIAKSILTGTPGKTDYNKFYEYTF